MEKRTPHCRLAVVHALVDAGKVRMTLNATAGAATLGLNAEGVVEVIKGLRPANFYKSMTTYADHTIWQDVYRTATTLGDVYLKLTVIDDVLVVSFKEL